jgi:spermidine synthase
MSDTMAPRSRPSTVGQRGEAASTPRIPIAVPIGCFFLSGATSLVYQVVWLRMLVLIFGHTVQAVTTVLAAFMVGLALGSFLWGRRSAEVGNPLRAYGWLEIGIGVYAALLPALLWLVPSLYLGLRTRLDAPTFGAVQFLGMSGLLLIPTALMGGTLPLLSQALTRSAPIPARVVGALYAVNTLGAAIGTALAGYALLPALGNRTTLWITAATNVVVGALALWYGRQPIWSEPVATAPQPRAGETLVAEAGTEAWDWGTRLTVAAIAVSGAVSMLYEVAWTRALALVIGSSTYAFTAMLLAFLIGIAGGSAIYASLRRTTHRPSPAAFAAIQVGIGVAVMATVLLFEDMPALFLIGLSWSTSPAFVQLLEVWICVGALLPSTLLIGATFPCALDVVARVRGPVGERVGQVFAANTVGAIVGAILAGFVLLPALGAHTSIRAGIAINLLLAVTLLATAARFRALVRWSAVTAILALAVGASVIPHWDPRVMSSGPAIYGAGGLRWTGREGFARTVRARSLVYYRDGLSSTVSVHRDGENLFLRVNGKTDAGTGGDMQTQALLGHLPLLIHPHPERVLVIGLGSGVTAGAVARHPVARIDIAEIEPAMLAAARLFAGVNGKVLDDRRVRLLITDGRNHLLTEPDRYDVIISEPSNPWISGLASLFSVEFFQLARSRLRPDGLMTQWVQAYDLAPEDLRMILNSFATAFPHTTVWGNVEGDLILIGQVTGAPLDLERIRQRFEGSADLRGDLSRVRIFDWPNLLGLFLLEEPGLGRLVQDAALNTDDRLPLEFSAPRTLYLQTGASNRALLMRFRTAVVPEVTPESRRELERPEVRFGIGMGFSGQDLPEEALGQLQQALRLDSRHAPSLFWAGAIYLQRGRPLDALPLVRRASELDPRNGQILALAGDAALQLNKPADAVAYLERAVAIEPTNPQFREMLGRARLAVVVSPR